MIAGGSASVSFFGRDQFCRATLVNVCLTNDSSSVILQNVLGRERERKDDHRSRIPEKEIMR